MKTFNKISFILLIIAVNFGCSSGGLDLKTGGGSAASTTQNGAETSAKQDVSGESTKKSPCANVYNPVQDGKIKNYKSSSGGGDVKFVQKYIEGESKFVEEFTVGSTIVKHFWECTDEGLIAANPGSMMDSKNMQLEPKHISGVTLPKESEMKIGKTWSTVYEAKGKSQIGSVNSTVTINNKLVSLDDEIKVPAGTFKAAKVETVINVNMKINGSSFPTPPIKSAVWFAPNVGMLKSGTTDGSFGNAVIEYAGDK